MDIQLNPVVDQLHLPLFSYTNILITKGDLIEFGFISLVWVFINVLILAFVPTLAFHERKQDEAGDDPNERKKMLAENNTFKMEYVSFVFILLSKIFGGYYFFVYGLREDTWCSKFEYTICATGLSHYLVDMIFTLCIGIPNRTVMFHHILCVLGSLYPFLYRRFGSEIVMSSFFAEISGAFRCLNYLFYLIDDNSIANAFWFLFRRRDIDDSERKRRAKIIRIGNDFAFMGPFIIARTVGFEYIISRTHARNAPFFLKQIMSSMWILSLTWVYESVNKTAKIFALEIFPKNEKFQKVYAFLKGTRPYMQLYLLAVSWYSYRYLQVYYGIYDYLFQMVLGK